MRLRAAGVAIITAALTIHAGHVAAEPQGRSRPVPPAATAAPAAATLAGTVVAAADGKGLGRARVMLSSPLLTQARVTVSDDEGRFSFADVPAGAYELLVMRTGYALAANGGTRGWPVRVTAGQPRIGVIVPMQPESVIPGRLYDEDASPLAGAEVEAVSLRASDGRPTMAPAATTHTDDRGEFRLTGLSAGQYFIAARDKAFTNVADAGGTLRYPATYFPGGISAAGAQPVSVGTGQIAPRVEFRISLVKPARITGLLRPPDRKPLLSGAAILLPRDGSPLEALPPEDIELTPDGRFVFRNVPPGNYQLRARGSVDARQVPLFGSFAVTVLPGRDVDGITVPLTPGAVIRGRLEWSGRSATLEKSPPVAGLRVRAPFADGTSFGDTLSGTVAPDGSFNLRGVMSGPHFLTVEGLPAPWSIIGVRVHGRDMLLQPLNVHESEQLHNVRIVLSDEVIELSGLVRARNGQALPDALVLAAPTAVQAWSSVDPRFRTIRTDGEGRYRLHGLPPGSYGIVALSGSDELAIRRPEWLARAIARASPVTLAGTEKRALDLTAVAADALMPSVTR
jgi:hypothetical protein